MSKQILVVALFLLASQQVFGAGFPNNFIWGASTAAYQIEGAWNDTDKGQSWWDWYSNDVMNFTQNLSGNVATDFFHRFREDIGIMQSLGLKNFRMSIAWPRVLPNATVNQPSQNGINFYNIVFDALHEAGIEPWVTLYHCDMPQVLITKDNSSGWLNANISNLFNDYADFCFRTFGSKVKNWITINEPLIAAWFGYGLGSGVPLRCTSSKYNNTQCDTVGGGGDSGREPYLAAHNMILSHAKAVRTYWAKYKPTNGGQIGWTLNVNFALPWNASDPLDVAAVETYLVFNHGWFADPIFTGDYPNVMKEYITNNRLPTFTPEEQQIIKGATDYYAINHYTSSYIQHTGIVGDDFGNDARCVANTSDVNGVPIGPVGEADWLYVYAPGIRGIMNWISNRYNKPAIMVLENGFCVKNESYTTVPKAIVDYQRIQYLNDYIDNVVNAVTVDGVNVTGYFVWSFIDNFEWGSYIPRFGMVYVDYNNNLTRYPKASAYFYSQKTSNIQSWARGQSQYPTLRNNLAAYENDESLAEYLLEL